MKAYQTEIIDNVVSYIAKHYKVATHRDINQTMMYKIIALFDFRCLKLNGTPCTDLIYKARERGPVPEELYNGKFSKQGVSFSTKRRNGAKYFISTKEPDMDYLKPSEQKILDNVLNLIISNNFTVKQACDLTHKEIISWKKAYEREHNSCIDLSDEFEGLNTKSERDMTVPELNFINYRESLRVQGR